jgi:nitrous oxidase accessory protein NosD
MKTAISPLPHLEKIPQSQRSQIIIVDQQNCGDYTSITDAIQAAANSCLIIVRPGRYEENLRIDRAITIIGDSAELEPAEIHGSIVCDHDGNIVIQNVSIYRNGLGIDWEEESRQRMLMPEECEVTPSNSSSALTSASGNLADVDNTVPSFDHNSVAVTVLQGKIVMRDCLIQGGHGMSIHICNPQTHLTIHNCVIEKGRYGIYQESKTWVETEHCIIRKTKQFGLLADANSHLIMRHCQVHSIINNGVLLNGCDLAVIDHCQISDTGEVGILVRSVVDFQIKNTQVYQHQQNGMCLQNGSQGLIEDCEVFNNGWPNVAILDRSNVEIRRSKIREGLSWGLKVAEGCRVQLEEVMIEAHNGHGIWLEKNSHADLRHCEIVRNAGAGLWLEPTSQASVEHSQFQQNGHGMRLGAIEVQGKVFLQGCLIRHNYSGVRSQKDSSVIIKRSNVSGNTNGALIQESGGTIGRHLNYEGLVPLLNLQHRGWKVAGALVGVAIGLYGTHRLTQFVQQHILQSQAQIDSLQLERDGIKEELEEKDLSNHILKQAKDEELAAKQKEIQDLKGAADAEKQRLERQKQDLESQLEQARRPLEPMVSPIVPEPRVMPSESLVPPIVPKPSVTMQPESTSTKKPSIESAER